MTCGYCGEKFTPATRGNGKHRKYCSDRCRRDAYEKQGPGDPCVVCGGPCGTQRRGSTTRRCDECRRAEDRERVESRARQIEKWWAAGVPWFEIGRRMGWDHNSTCWNLGTLRKQGYRLPYRYGEERRSKARERRWGKAA